MHKISFLDLSLRINNSINLNLPVANELRKAKFTRIMTPVTNHGIFNGIFNVIYSSLKVSFVFTFEKIYVNFQYFINHTSYHAIYLAVAKGNHHRWTHSRVWPCCQNYCIWCMLLIIFGWNSAIFQPSLLSVSLQPFLGKLLIRLTSKYMYIFVIRFICIMRHFMISVIPFPSDEHPSEAACVMLSYHIIIVPQSF